MKSFEDKKDHIEIYVLNTKLASVNGKYNKNFSLSREYRQCKEFLKNLFESKRNGRETIDGFFQCNIYTEQYADIDNYLKVQFDALELSGIVANDRNCTALRMFKKVAKRGTNPAIKIEIIPLSEQEQKRNEEIYFRWQNDID